MLTLEELNEEGYFYDQYPGDNTEDESGIDNRYFREGFKAFVPGFSTPHNTNPYGSGYAHNEWNRGFLEAAWDYENSPM